jgi:hypothetical protein
MDAESGRECDECPALIAGRKMKIGILSCGGICWNVM